MNRSNYSSCYCCQRKNSNYGSKAPSNKKIKFTDRTAAGDEKRLIPSEGCKQKMLILIDKLLDKPRREGQDWKLRENILKKIDEKYIDSFN